MKCSCRLADHSLSSSLQFEVVWSLSSITSMSCYLNERKDNFTYTHTHTHTHTQCEGWWIMRKIIIVRVPQTRVSSFTQCCQLKRSSCRNKCCPVSTKVWKPVMYVCLKFLMRDLILLVSDMQHLLECKILNSGGIEYWGCYLLWCDAA